MDSCVRGFSFMPETKVEVTDLQFIEEGELSRAWKTSRRQRLKDVEQKIWDEFVKEQDIIRNVCNDDPYLFLENLPEATLKELMETELSRMQKEKDAEDEREIKQPCPQQGSGDVGARGAAPEHIQTMVTFAEEDAESCDMLHIFDDEKDDVSGPEQEVINESMDSPSTVRERLDGSTAPGSPNERQPSPEKSNENVGYMIETSIYAAKVKELQSKVIEEILSVITTLEAQDFTRMDPLEVPKLQKQSSEFCARYGRIYLYQLQRQIHDMARHSSSALPFARHTQLRSQMNRAASLHQHMLQALQVLHKWFSGKGALRECVDALRSFSLLATHAHEQRVCPDDVHSDEILLTCEKLDFVLEHYTQRMTNFLNSCETMGTTRSRKSHGRNAGKKRSFATCSKAGSKQSSSTEARLSMYSLDTLRVNATSTRSSSTRVNPSSGTSKIRLGIETVQSANKPETTEVAQKGQKKTPRSRRPLMRAPRGAAPRRRAPDTDIQTMVEAVGMCNSSHISREDSPRSTLEKLTPRSKATTPRRTRNITPRRKDIPKITPRIQKEPPKTNKMAPKQFTSQDNLIIVTSSGQLDCETVSPVIKVQCSKKEEVKEEKEAVSPKVAKVADTPKVESPKVARAVESPRVKERDNKVDKDVGATSEVSRLLRKLCGVNSIGGRNERVSGARNAQLLCVNGSSPRQPSTPQLLRILEETIQKKTPRPIYPKPQPVKDLDRYRMSFNVPLLTAENMFQYRKTFVQHMLSSPMYANGAVAKPWEMIGSVSDQIIDEILLTCAKEMQLEDFVHELYKSEAK